MSAHAITVKLWGVRGSIPSTMTPLNWRNHTENHIRNFFALGYRNPADLQKYLDSHEMTHLGGYGSATTCVEVTSPKGQVIIDGGSGIQILSERIMTGTYGRSKGPFHIMMTHFHWDHVIGLPFFAPHFIPGTVIHYYGVQSDLEVLIRGIFRKPYFPVPFEALGAKIHFHVLEPRKAFLIDDMTITPYKLDHPDPCWGYKIESHGKTYAHCVDTEGTRVSRDEMAEDLPLYQGIDLMYFDAQYTFGELAEKSNWGHSAAQIGLDLAFREGIKQIIFGHHDPGAGIQDIEDIKRQTLEYFNWRKEHARDSDETLPEVLWDFAYDGMEIAL